MTPRDRFLRARIRIMALYPFLQEAIMRMRLIETTLSLGKAATNGQDFFYDPILCEKIDDNEAMFIVAHEAFHLLFGHIGRRQNRDSNLWNIACDMVVNSLIEEMGRTKKDPNSRIESIKGVFYIPDEVGDAFVEWLYDYLNKNGVKNAKLLTSHDMWKDNPAVEGSWKDTLNRSKGKFPSNKTMELELSSISRIPWQKELYMYMKSEMLHDYSPHRYRRIKSVGLSYYLPRLISPYLRVAVVLDTSGSISKEQGTVMLEETHGIISAFDHFELLLIMCDAEVHKVFNIHPGDDLPKVLVGRGGTSFIPAFEKVKELQFSPDCLIYFSDTMGIFPSIQPAYPVIWGVVGARGKVPWGKKIDVIFDE